VNLPVPKDLTPEEVAERDLKDDYKRLLNEKIPLLEETLSDALNKLFDVQITAAAKDFRKIATDLKLLEHLITHRGTLSPKNTLNDLTGKEWLQHTKSWLVVDGKPSDISKEIKGHPGSFPPELAEYFISFFSKRGQWVIDPFMGIGSTAEACWTTGRNCLGIDLNTPYIQYARKRITKHLSNFSSMSDTDEFLSPIIKDDSQDLAFYLLDGDCRELPKKWAEYHLPQCTFLITSPPYWNMLRTSRGGVKSTQKQRIEEGLDSYYSDRPEDLGNITEYEQYITQLVDLFVNLRPLLAPKAFLVIILQNCRPSDGIMRPLAWDFARALSIHYNLRQEFIWCQDQKFMGIWGWPTTYVSNVHHHYCLVFQNH
jgi:DNA modification methylase